MAESFLKDASLVVTYYARLTARPVDALRRLISLAVPFFALKLPRSACTHRAPSRGWAVVLNRAGTEPRTDRICLRAFTASWSASASSRLRSPVASCTLSSNRPGPAFLCAYMY